LAVAPAVEEVAPVQPQAVEEEVVVVVWVSLSASELALVSTSVSASRLVSAWV
jgi:hypothetical protein